MNVREWTVKAQAESVKLRARWPRARVIPGVSVLSISVISADEEYVVKPHGDEAWTCRFWDGKDAVAAVEEAIRAEQDEARAKLERMAIWGVK
jgi:hypothetical protein